MESITPHTYRIHIGIDPGTKTGFAVWDRSERRFLCINTLRIDDAMMRVLALMKDFPSNIYVRFEDSRLISGSNQRTMGAGSIRRDCSIWEGFLEANNIPYSGNKPVKGMTKWSEDIFKLTTGWQTITSNHGRDAAVLVFDR